MRLLLAYLAILSAPLPAGQALPRLADADVEQIVVQVHTRGRTGTFPEVPRVFAKNGDRFEDGQLGMTQAQLDTLRACILGSRPQLGGDAPSIHQNPGPYLERAGLTDQVLDDALPAIWKACVSERWVGPNDPLPEVPAELEPLFTPDATRRRMRDYLCRTQPGYSDRSWVVVTLPGEPRIYLGTSALRSKTVPWYVNVAGAQWYCLDREVSRALFPLASLLLPLGRLEGPACWPLSVLTDPNEWPILRAQVDEFLCEARYQRSAGWDEVARDFRVVDLRPRPTTEPWLPALTLIAHEPRPIERVVLHAKTNDELDWNAVLAFHRRAERAVEAQPLLARWVAHHRHRDRISLSLPAGINDLVRSEGFSTELWKREGLRGNPEFAISLQYRPLPREPEIHLTASMCAMSAQGDLIIVTSQGPRGPLGKTHASLCNNGVFGVVGANGVAEIRER